MSIQSIAQYIASCRPIKFTVGAVQAYFLYELWESAISQMLVVDTCRHGTKPQYYFSILTGGLDATKCECEWGEGVPMVYLWRDTRHLSGESRMAAGFFGALAYAAGNPWGILKFHFRPEDSTYGEYWKKVNIPTEQLQGKYAKYYPDFDGIDGFYPNLGRIWPTTIRSPQAVPSIHIGITGSLTQGVNLGLPKRIRYNPLRFIKGLTQGAIALYLTSGFLQKKLGVSLFSPTSKFVVWPKQLGEAARNYRMINGLANFCEKAWSYRIIRWPLKAVGNVGLWYSAR